MNFRVEQSNGEYGRWRLTDGGKDVAEFDADFETAAGAAEGAKMLVLKATKLWGMTGEVVERCDKYIEQLRGGARSAGPSVAQLQAAAIAVADAAADGSRAEPVLRCFADIEPRQVDWLWAGRVPAGRLLENQPPPTPRLHLSAQTGRITENPPPNSGGTRESALPLTKH